LAIARVLQWVASEVKPHDIAHFLDEQRVFGGLNPPDRALVLCVDEKSQIQALDRSRGSSSKPASRRSRNRWRHLPTV
jgi:hypothetical protein